MKVTPISQQKHSQTKIKVNNTFAQAKNQNLTLLTAQEFALASREYVIAFIKDSETGQFRPVALLGLTKEENLFYSEDGWKAGYVPQNLQAYPFGGQVQENSDQTIVCIYEDSHLVNDSEGESLFDAEGNNTDFLNKKAALVKTLLQNSWSTQHFAKYLADHQLIKPQSLTIRLEGQEPYDLNGMYVIDEKKLNEVSDEEFIEIRKRGYLGPIYAALISQANINALAKLKVSKERSQ